MLFDDRQFCFNISGWITNCTIICFCFPFYKYITHHFEVLSFKFHKSRKQDNPEKYFYLNPLRKGSSSGFLKGTQLITTFLINFMWILRVTFSVIDRSGDLSIYVDLEGNQSKIYILDIWTMFYQNIWNKMRCEMTLDNQWRPWEMSR